LPTSRFAHWWIRDPPTASSSKTLRLGLAPTPRPGLTVGVVNGERVACTGFCPTVHVVIRDEAFTIDCFVIPRGGLRRYEMVLGYQWLSTLGPIMWDFGRRTMSLW